MMIRTKACCVWRRGLNPWVINSFGCIFWDQQSKALKRKSSSGMRWHPLMIKWCLHLHHHSSSEYETLHKSGCISFPSQRTLRDYTTFCQRIFVWCWLTAHWGCWDCFLSRLEEACSPLEKTLCMTGFPVGAYTCTCNVYVCIYTYMYMCPYIYMYIQVLIAPQVLWLGLFVSRIIFPISSVS